LGAESQDYVNGDWRFEKNTDGSSDLGNFFSASFHDLRALCPGALNGPLSVPMAAVRPARSTDPKLQRNIAKQIEDHRAKDLAMRHEALDPEGRRRISFESRYSRTMAFVSTALTKASQVGAPGFIHRC
jgi:hypothetical protein